MNYAETIKSLSIENNMNPIINDMITTPSIEKFAYA